MNRELAVALTLVDVGTDHRATFEWCGTLMDRSHVQWVVHACAADGRLDLDLCCSTGRGRPVEQPIVEPRTGRVLDCDPDSALSEGVLVARYPGWALDDLGPDWGWTASVLVDGRVLSDFVPPSR